MEEMWRACATQRQLLLFYLFTYLLFILYIIFPMLQVRNKPTELPVPEGCRERVSQKYG